MARGFRRTRDGRYVCRLGADEAFVVRRVAADLAALLDGAQPPPPDDSDTLTAMVGLPAHTPPRPDDPVLARLFPDGYADDRDAAEFRRYTQGELQAGKRAALAVLLATVDEAGGEVRLDDEQAQAWLTALNDLRLALGTRVGVTEDNVDALAALPPDDPRGALFALYDFLTYLQGTLVDALARW